MERSRALITAVVVGVVGAIAFVAIRRRDSGDGAQVPHDSLAEGARLAPTLRKEARIEPYRLIARVPAGWTCNGPSGWTVECGPGVPHVRWFLADETSALTNAQLIEEASRTQNEARPITLAGFEGVYTYWSSRKAPEYTRKFEGFAQHPKRGRVRLLVEMFADGVAADVAIAVMLTTTRAPEGLPEWLPSQDELRHAEWMHDAYGRLADEKGTATVWSEALRGLGTSAAAVSSTSASAAILGPMYERAPSVTELVQKRVDYLGSGDNPKDFGDAIGLTRGLRRWDKAGAIALYTKLADRAARLRDSHLKDDTLGDWLDHEVTIAHDRAELADKDALPALTKSLRVIDPSVLFRKNPSALYRLALAKDPSTEALLGSIFARPLPADADHAKLVQELRYARESAAVRRFLGARLNDRSKTGTKRVCDVYAAPLASTAGLPFNAADPVDKRDKAIAAIRAWVLE
ncbi:MAG: hypothetical protein HYV09_02625 [Deltaproteobacteria bacterium]|nr:hypothetical protein [Deltaproteobacteria bacterium]